MQTTKSKLERIEFRYFIYPSIYLTDWQPLIEFNKSDIITGLPEKREAEFKGDLFRIIKRL